MPAKVIQTYLSTKTWVCSKELLCNACPRKLQFASHYNFSWQEACGWDSTCHDHLQPHVLLRHSVWGKMTELQGCSCAQPWAPPPSRAWSPSPGCGHQECVRNIQKCMKREGCLFSPMACRAAGTPAQGECALKASASQCSRGHFLATARWFGLKMY